MSDDERVSYIDAFQQPFIDKCNALIKRFINKRAGLGPKEVPMYENIVDSLINVLDNKTKATEIIIYTMCSLCGFIRETVCNIYIDNMGKNKMELLKLISDELNSKKEHMILMIEYRISELYVNDIKMAIPRGETTFIKMDVNKEGLIKALREKFADKRIPSTLRTGF